MKKMQNGQDDVAVNVAIVLITVFALGAFLSLVVTN